MYSGLLDQILYIELRIHGGQGKAAIPIHVQPIRGEVLWISRPVIWVIYLSVKGRI